MRHVIIGAGPAGVVAAETVSASGLVRTPSRDGSLPVKPKGIM